MQGPSFHAILGETWSECGNFGGRREGSSWQHPQHPPAPAGSDARTFLVGGPRLNANRVDTSPPQDGGAFRSQQHTANQPLNNFAASTLSSTCIAVASRNVKARRLPSFWNRSRDPFSSAHTCKLRRRFVNTSLPFAVATASLPSPIRLQTRSFASPRLDNP